MTTKPDKESCFILLPNVLFYYVTLCLFIKEYIFEMATRNEVHTERLFLKFFLPFKLDRN